MARPRAFDLEQFYGRAMEVFWTKGFAATSMADVYAATGLGPGSVYSIVKDKDELFQRVFESYAVRFRQTMEGELRGFEALSAWMDTQVEFLSEDPQRKGCLIANTIMERDSHSAETQAQAQARIEEILAYFRKQILAGQAEGSVAATLETGAAAEGLLGSTMGLMALARGRAPKSTLQSIAASALDALRPSRSAKRKKA